MTSPTEEKADRRRLLRYVMIAVLAWGTMLALGALLFGYDQKTGAVAFAPNLWRGLVMEACVLAFVGGWWLLIRRRSAS